jgi:hypothetical protein
MKRHVITATIFFCLLVLVGCPKLEQDARDTAAALGGAVTAAQRQHSECVSGINLAQCNLINKAVDTQNALITSIEAYCGWTVGVLPTNPGAKCVPVSTAQAGLQSAVSNANVLIGQLKGIIQ